MGVVYKAEDTRLKRTVALKFVVPRMGWMEKDRQRFIREAQVAASLNHPRICTIYGIDETEEGIFIAMEYVEGRTLREKLDQGPLEPGEILDIASQIAEGLSEAHRKGIIHRDIKSSNIMITPRGEVKIMDFGLARPVREASVTETASIVGTVAYMSPEQASGEVVDQRTDIWSLGVVLYEMVAGRRPFEAEHEQLVLHAILSKNPDPLPALSEGIPSDLGKVITRCLEKDPSYRYPNAATLLEDLESLKQGRAPLLTVPSSKTEAAAKTKKPALPLIAAAAVFLAAVLLAVGALFLSRLFSPGGARPFAGQPWKASIAVLPVIDMRPDHPKDYLCSGTTMSIISKLSLITRDLRVIPYVSVEKYSGPSVDLEEISRRLNVENILQSRLMSEGDRVRIKAELIYVPDERVVNALEETFELDGLFSVQDKIASLTAEKMGVHFNEAGIDSMQNMNPATYRAFELYSEGMDILDKQDTFPTAEAWYSLATARFSEALALEPDYALAYWGLGAAEEAYYVATKEQDHLEAALSHFRKAYTLNPGQAETNIGLGWAYFYREDLDTALRSFRKALDIQPHDTLVNCDIGSFLASIGLYRKAIEYYTRAVRNDPTYAVAYVFSAMCHWYLGRFEEGAALAEKALELEADNPAFRLERAAHLLMLGRLEEAEAEMDRAESLRPGSSSPYRMLLEAQRGNRERALSLVKEADCSFIYPVTCTYAIVGMKEEAVSGILQGIEDGFKKEQRYIYTYPLLNKHPTYRLLRGDPRFERILKEQKERYKERLKKVKAVL